MINIPNLLTTYYNHIINSLSNCFINTWRKIGSIQHILLAMAAKEQLGDAHALDNNIAAMAHPDGMTALLSGSVKCQLTTSPFVFKEAEKEDMMLLYMFKMYIIYLHVPIR